MNKTKIKVIANLIRSQAEQAIGAATAGDTIKRHTIGLSIEKNLKVLQAAVTAKHNGNAPLCKSREFKHRDNCCI